jgi:periplasmic protein TonB
MSTKPVTAPVAPERVAGVFFRWEIPEEGAAVDIHLNVVELLERDALRARGRLTGGFLLGRVTRGRILTLTIEHYEPVTPERGMLVSPFADQERMEAMISRWRPGHSRLSLIGLYRTCTPQNVFLTNDDLGALGAYFRERVAEVISTSLAGSKLSASQAIPEGCVDAGEAERIFLLIEPGIAGANSKAVLHLTRGGTVVWQSPSTLFNRNELSRRRAANQTQASEKRAPSEAVEESSEPAREEGSYAPKASVAKARALKWGAISLGVAMLLVTTFFELRGRVDLGALFASAPAAAPPDTHLGLKLDQSGSSWKLSWNAEAPALTDATGGRLVVTDGGMHKEIDLDEADLRGGTIIYSPITQDVVLRLEVESPASSEPVSESVRTVGGLLVSPLPSTDSANPVPGAADGDTAQRLPVPPVEPGATPNLRNAGEPNASLDSARTAEEELGALTAPSVPKSPAPVQTTQLPRAEIKPVLNEPQPPAPAATVPTMTHALEAPQKQKPSSAEAQARIVQSPKIAAPARNAELRPTEVPKKIEPARENARNAGVHSRVTSPVPTPQPHLVSEALPVVAKRAPVVPMETIHRAVAEVAELISKRDPDYPVSARQARVSGAVEVEFTIDADGRVRDVRVARGPMLLASAAVEAVQEWRYRPARLDGVPVATQGNAVLVFHMD